MKNAPKSPRSAASVDAAADEPVPDGSGPAARPRAVKPVVAAKLTATAKPKLAAKPEAAAKLPVAAKPKATAKAGASGKPSAGETPAAHTIGLPKRVRPARKVAAAARLDMARRIVALAEDKKAADILLLDLEGLTTLADAFVICSGGSERQLESIAEGIVRGMREEGIRPIGTEGLPASHWILVDFGDVIVHIFTPPERDYYGLEKHWSEAKAVLRVQ